MMVFPENLILPLLSLGSLRCPGLSHEDLHRIFSAIFESGGMSVVVAGQVAQSLVLADLQAVHSHGVIRVPEYVAKLIRLGVNPVGCPAVVKQRGAALDIDGGNSMGQAGARFAMEKAIDAAREHGLAFAAIRGSNHCGALQQITRMALPHGMIGLMASGVLPTMAPFGGLDKIVGDEPVFYRHSIRG